MGFSKQEYWSGLPFPSPGDLPHPGIGSGPSALQADSLPSELPLSTILRGNGFLGPKSPGGQHSIVGVAPHPGAGDCEPVSSLPHGSLHEVQNWPQKAWGPLSQPGLGHLCCWTSVEQSGG